MSKPDFSNLVEMTCTNPTCPFTGFVEPKPEQTPGEKFAKSVGMFLVGAIGIGLLWAVLSVLLMLLVIGMFMIWLTPLAALVGGIITTYQYLKGGNCPVCDFDSLELAETIDEG